MLCEKLARGATIAPLPAPGAAAAASAAAAAAGSVAPTSALPVIREPDSRGGIGGAPSGEDFLNGSLNASQQFMSPRAADSSKKQRHKKKKKQKKHHRDREDGEEEEEADMFGSARSKPAPRELEKASALLAPAAESAGEQQRSGRESQSRVAGAARPTAVAAVPMAERRPAILVDDHSIAVRVIDYLCRHVAAVLNVDYPLRLVLSLISRLRPVAVLTVRRRRRRLLVLPVLMVLLRQRRRCRSGLTRLLKRQQPGVRIVRIVGAEAPSFVRRGQSEYSGVGPTVRRADPAGLAAHSLAAVCLSRPMKEPAGHMKAEFAEEHHLKRAWPVRYMSGGGLMEIKRSADDDREMFLRRLSELLRRELARNDNDGNLLAVGVMCGEPKDSLRTTSTEVGDDQVGIAGYAQPGDSAPQRLQLVPSRLKHRPADAALGVVDVELQVHGWLPVRPGECDVQAGIAQHVVTSTDMLNARPLRSGNSRTFISDCHLPATVEFIASRRSLSLARRCSAICFCGAMKSTMKCSVSGSTKAARAARSNASSSARIDSRRRMAATVSSHWARAASRSGSLLYLITMSRRSRSGTAAPTRSIPAAPVWQFGFVVGVTNFYRLRGCLTQQDWRCARSVPRLEHQRRRRRLAAFLLLLAAATSASASASAAAAAAAAAAATSAASASSGSSGSRPRPPIKMALVFQKPGLNSFFSASRASSRFCRSASRWRRSASWRCRSMASSSSSSSLSYICAAPAPALPSASRERCAESPPSAWRSAAPGRATPGLGAVSWRAAARCLTASASAASPPWLRSCRAKHARFGPVAWLPAGARPGRFVQLPEALVDDALSIAPVERAGGQHARQRELVNARLDQLVGGEVQAAVQLLDGVGIDIAGQVVPDRAVGGQRHPAEAAPLRRSGVGHSSRQAAERRHAGLRVRRRSRRRRQELIVGGRFARLGVQLGDLVHEPLQSVLLAADAAAAAPEDGISGSSSSSSSLSSLREQALRSASHGFADPRRRRSCRARRPVGDRRAAPAQTRTSGQQRAKAGGLRGHISSRLEDSVAVVAVVSGRVSPSSTLVRHGILAGKLPRTRHPRVGRCRSLAHVGIDAGLDWEARAASACRLASFMSSQ
uniref:Protein kinase domain-containing protein n=1 Tax=Macrostomum lignano TaxID=282301 RepID=A0A1I8HFQ1_9PLAT